MKGGLSPSRAPTSMHVAVVFEGDARMNEAVAAILLARGYTVVSFAEQPADVVWTVKSLGAELVILELAMVGARGLRIVQDVRQAVRDCQVIFLSPFETLRAAGLAAGALELVGTDLGVLERCLLDQERRRQPATSATFAPPSRSLS